MTEIRVALKRVNIRDLRLDRLERLIDRLPPYDFGPSDGVLSRSGWRLYEDAYFLILRRRKALHSIVVWNGGRGFPVINRWWNRKW
jgi:hypothetical protein